MNRNQKIAIGCGGAGCLGLIFLVVVCGVAFYYYSGRLSRTSASDTNFNYNFNSNHNSNSNSDSNSTSSSNTNEDRTPDTSTSTNDSELMHKVWKKLGLMDADNTPNENYAQFAREHIAWLFRNSDFLKEVDTPDKARAYVNEHIED